jgi:hypothetical protein
MQITQDARGQIALSSNLSRLVYVTAAIDLVIGVLFFFGPELPFVLWPSDIPPLLFRFIGAIVLGNGFGAALAARQATWEGARVIFTVALIYGVAVLIGLLYNLLFKAAPSIFWVYVIVDAVFLAPIAYIYWTHERAYRNARGA